MTNSSNNSNASTVATPTVTLQQMIQAGAYDYVSPYVGDKYFGPESLVTGREPRLFDVSKRPLRVGFLPTVPVDDPFDHVVADMAEQGFRPASLGDLLDYGAKNPGEQLKHIAIVALGSVTKLAGWREVVALGHGDHKGNDTKRNVSMYRIEGEGPSPGDKFLAVRI